jgi:hypothetical protein
MTRVQRTAERNAGTGLGAIMWFVAGTMNRELGLCTSFALVALLTACEDDAFGSPRECQGPISVVVSSGTSPHFTWTAACAVGRIVVRDATSVVWDVRSAPARILSPVRYGVRPSGATEEQAPAPLNAGETYHVAVHSDAQIVIGGATFTP